MVGNPYLGIISGLPFIREFEPVCGAPAPLALRRRSSAFRSVICSISYPVFYSAFEKALQLLY